METAFRYTFVLLFVLPMFFMAVVAVVSAMLVISDIPFRD